MAAAGGATGAGAGKGARVGDPGRVTDLAAAIARRELSPVALVERYLARIAEVDGDVQAWRRVDRDGALALARKREAEAKAGRLRGALHGLPFAVKDIIDVEGLTSLCNSRSRAGAAPAAADAEVVLMLRAAGAIPLGKVHTTEYAFFDPSPARNPWNLAHTPGGSSSGSAAAVAAGTAPISIGTQTVASVNRPAASCGIAAFKPSTGSMPGFGITPLAPSFDTAGFYGFTVEDAVAVYEALMPAFLHRATTAEPARSVRLVIPEDAHLDAAIPEMKAAMTRLADAFAAAGHAVRRVASPIDFARLFDLQREMMHYETGRALRFLEAQPAGSVGTHILAAVARGKAIPTAHYLGIRAEVAAMRAAVLEVVGGDTVLWPGTRAGA